MGQFMATVEVSEKLKSMENRIHHHEKLHEQNAETLKSVSEVLVNQARITEKQTNQQEQLTRHQQQVDDQFRKIDERFEKIFTKIEQNREQILKWSGGIAAILVVFSLVKFLV